MLKSSFKIYFISTLSSIMITNSIASVSLETLNRETLNKIQSNINKEKTISNEMLAKFEVMSEKKALDFKSFLKTHPEVKALNLPAAKIENNKIFFLIDNKKIEFTMLSSGTINATFNSQKIEITNKMSFEEIFQKFNFTHTAVLATTIVATLFYGYAPIKNFVATIDKLNDACKKMNDTTNDEEIDFGVLQESYNKLTDLGFEICAYNSHIAYQKSSCSQIPIIKKCFKEKIHKMSSGAINDSIRNSLKEDQYEANQDKLITGAIQNK